MNEEEWSSMRLMGRTIPEMSAMQLHILIPVAPIGFIACFVVCKAIYDALVKYYQDSEDKQS